MTLAEPSGPRFRVLELWHLQMSLDSGLVWLNRGLRLLVHDKSLPVVHGVLARRTRESFSLFGTSYLVPPWHAQPLLEFNTLRLARTL